MRKPPILASCLALGLGALALIATPSESSVRKCNTTPNGLRIETGGPVYIIDGTIYPFIPDPSEPRAGRAPAPLSDLSAADVLHIEMVCIEVFEPWPADAGAEGERKVGRVAVAVVTKPGAVGFMQSHLRALAELQEEHRTRTGAYAKSLRELDFFSSRAPLPIVMTVHPDGWVAEARVEGIETACRVGGGSHGNHESDRVNSVVQCEAG